MKHDHEFIVTRIGSRIGGIFSKQVKTTVTLQCRECGYTVDSTSTHSVDVVSINDKLYFIPRYFFVYSPIELVDQSARSSVEYAELASGIYVPTKYVSGTVTKTGFKFFVDRILTRGEVEGS